MGGEESGANPRDRQKFGAGRGWGRGGRAAENPLLADLWSFLRPLQPHAFNGLPLSIPPPAPLFCEFAELSQAMTSFPWALTVGCSPVSVFMGFPHPPQPPRSFPPHPHHPFLRIYGALSGHFGARVMWGCTVSTSKRGSEGAASIRPTQGRGCSRQGTTKPQ